MLELVGSMQQPSNCIVTLRLLLFILLQQTAAQRKSEGEEEEEREDGVEMEMLKSPE